MFILTLQLSVTEGLHSSLWGEQGPQGSCCGVKMGERGSDLYRTCGAKATFASIFRTKKISCGHKNIIYKNTLRIDIFKQPFSYYLLFCLWRIMIGKFSFPPGAFRMLAVDQIWKTGSCTHLCAVLARLAEWKPPSEVPHRLPALLSGSSGRWKQLECRG